MLPPSLGEKKKPDLSIQKKIILKFSLHHLLELILIYSLIILYTTILLQQCLFQDLTARQHQRRACNFWIFIFGQTFPWYELMLNKTTYLFTQKGESDFSFFKFFATQMWYDRAHTYSTPFSILGSCHFIWWMR